jgi:hypothetical protein
MSEQRFTAKADDGTEFTIIVAEDQPSVPAGALEANLRERGITPRPHDCIDHPVPYVSDGRLGHGWECGVCGAFLQAG